MSTVKLTREEEAMLRGDQGEAKKLAMEVLMRLAVPFAAEEFVPVSSVQAMAHYGSLHDAGLEWLEKLAAMGGKCSVPTTQDPASIPFATWKEHGFDSVYADKQMRLAKAITELGENLTWCCTPYFVGMVPRYGENVAWAESSAVSYANSVIGARTNRTPAGLAICAAITGRIPKERMYLDENRVATVKINIDVDELTALDYNTIGIKLGKAVGTKIPALTGIPNSCTAENLKYLGASAAASGSVAMFHILGVTPEAFDRDPFKGKKPVEEITWTREDLAETERDLTTKNAGVPEIAVVGCPHYTINELSKLASLVAGKKVRKGKEFWIYTPFETENLAKRMGLVKILLEAGVQILASSCLVISPFPRPYKTIITDSGKFASYLPSEHNVGLVYASMEDCVKAILN